ncbi:MAG: hypothetical protein V4669_05870 [Pseudomonadota bacterium]
MKFQMMNLEFHGLQLESAIRRALNRSRGVVLVGPRQAGKSTLAQRFVPRGMQIILIWNTRQARSGWPI